MDYRTIIVESCLKRGNFVSAYFYRQFKEAEKQDISGKEFFANLETELSLIRAEISRPYPGNFGNHTTFPLLHLTNGKYKGEISLEDVAFIQAALYDGYEKFIEEKLAAEVSARNLLVEKIDTLSKSAFKKPQWLDARLCLLYLFKIEGKETLQNYAGKIAEKLNSNSPNHILWNVLPQVNEYISLVKKGEKVAVESNACYKTEKLLDDPQKIEFLKKLNLLETQK